MKHNIQIERDPLAPLSGKPLFTVNLMGKQHSTLHDLRKSMDRLDKVLTTSRGGGAPKQ